MFDSKNEKEEKINYEVTVIGVRQTKHDNMVMVDLDVNGVKIYSCILKEITVKKDGKKYKEGDTCYVLNLPQEKGTDGKWYDRVWFPVSSKITESVCKQVEHRLNQ